MKREPLQWITAASLAGLMTLAVAADWTNAGGNAGRNGQTSAIGPDSPKILWSGGPSSIIAWQPVIEGDRVFIVRQTGFPPEPQSDESTVYALDLNTGEVIWDEDIPAAADDWTTWIAGVKDGRVFVSRSGNGASVSAKLRALDAATGATLWESDEEIDAGAYDGVIFAPDGDPVIASFTTIWRINAEDGSTVWSTPRLCSVSGSCGACAAANGAIYIADAAVGGHVLSKYDLETGDFQYSGPVMIGFTLQNTPMASPDGTIYLSRTQNNVATDFFYAFDDTGSALEIRWSVPAGWSTSSEFGVGPDHTVYMMGPGNVIQRLDPQTGDVIDTSAPIAADFLTPRFAIDAQGKVFFSNGAFSNGRVWSFNADLSVRWSVAVQNVNIGAPAIASDGTLIVCGVGADVRAYRTEQEICLSDIAPKGGDGAVGPGDLASLLADWGACEQCPADFDTDGEVGPADLGLLLASWGRCS
jgi:outer membrane protein assembly factor BamB